MIKDNIQLVVIMPAYNEEASIIHVVEKWTNELCKLDINFQIHVYNDGSQDNTLQILNNLADKNKQLIVHNKANSGHGPTLMQAYREHNNVPWLFQIDSDDEIEPDYLQEFWENREKYDFLIGKRKFITKPFIRRLTSFIASLTISIFYGNKVQDVNAPYRLMRNECFRYIYKALPNRIFSPNLAISGLVSIMNLRVKTINVQCKGRTTGKSSLYSFKLISAMLKSFIETIWLRFNIKNKIKKNQLSPNLLFTGGYQD